MNLTTRSQSRLSVNVINDIAQLSRSSGVSVGNALTHGVDGLTVFLVGLCFGVDKFTKRLQRVTEHLVLGSIAPRSHVLAH